MPTVALNIQAGPWDAKGRRMFRYVNARQKPVEMQQAINELTPYLTRYRGIDGFWVGQISTNQVPRPVVLGLLAKVDQKNQDERLKVTRWLIQAEWYPEAKAALDGLERDFPELKANVDGHPEGGDRAGVARRPEGGRAPPQGPAAARRPRRSSGASRPRASPGTSLDEVRDQIRKDQDQAVTDRLQADSLRDLAEKLTEADRKAWKGRLAEVLEVLANAPDAARPRLEALARADAAAPPEARFAAGDVGLGRRDRGGGRRPQEGRRPLEGPRHRLRLPRGPRRVRPVGPPGRPPEGGRARPRHDRPARPEDGAAAPRPRPRAREARRR